MHRQFHKIENYIDAVIRNAFEYVRSVRRKKHVDIKVIGRAVM